MSSERIECEDRADAQERLANAKRMGYPAELRQEREIWVLYLNGVPSKPLE